METSEYVCSCGAVGGHEDQRTKFPEGTLVRSLVRIENAPPFKNSPPEFLPIDSIGFVRDHCDDGRACILFIADGTIHTFHQIDSFLEIIPPITASELRSVLAPETLRNVLDLVLKAREQ